MALDKETVFLVENAIDAEVAVSVASQEKELATHRERASRVAAYSSTNIAAVCRLAATRNLLSLFIYSAALDSLRANDRAEASTNSNSMSASCH